MNGDDLMPPCRIVQEMEIEGRNYFIASEYVPEFEPGPDGARKRIGFMKTGAYFLATMESTKDYSILCRFIPSNPNGY